MDPTARMGVTVFRVLTLILIGTRFVMSQMGYLRLTDHALNVVLAKEGDINIGQLADVTTFSAATQKCGPARALAGCSMLQTGIYAVDQINRRSDILPNITLGMVIMDTCSKDTKTLEVVTYFGKQKTCTDTNSAIRSNVSLGLTEELKYYKIVGIVGPKSSTVSTMISSLMSALHIPLIATIPSSQDLSDKTRFKYFNRLVPPDNYLARGILDVIQYFSWFYISVVYNSGAYGESAYAEIRDSLPNLPDICMAVAIKISPTPLDAEYDAISKTLIANKEARIVVLFIDDLNKAVKFLTFMTNRIRTGHFIYIGTESLAGYEVDPRIGTMLTGSFAVASPTVAMPDFNNYLYSVTPAMSKGNTWMTRLWEDKYGCSFKVDRNQSSTVPPCSMNLTLDPTLCPIDPAQTNRIYDGFNIYATLLDSYIAEKCPDGFTNKEILSDCIKGDEILKRLRSTTFYGVLGKITFNENGDFIRNLILKQFYLPTPNAPKAVSKTVGGWNTTEWSMYINESMVTWSVYYDNLTDFGNDSLPPESFCSRPCFPRQFMIKDATKGCCWTCENCRENEIIVKDRTACAACPNFTWPNENDDTVCSPISPDYLHVSDFIAVALILVMILVFVLLMICFYVFVTRRQTKLILELGLHLRLTVLIGILILCVDVVTFLLHPRSTTSICSVRISLYHFGTSMICVPNLVRVARIYRKHHTGKVLADEPRVVQLEMASVISLLLIQLIFLVVSEAKSPAVHTLVMPNVFTAYVEIYCYQKTVFFIVSMCYNVCIMLVCGFMAFFCRKLPMAYNESSFMFISVSTTLFLWVVLIPAYFSVPQVHLQPAVLGFSGALNSLIALLVQFCPVIYTVEFVASRNLPALSTDNTTKKTTM